MPIIMYYWNYLLLLMFNWEWFLIFPIRSVTALQINQEIIAEPLTFHSDADRTIGQNCTFKIKSGKCTANKHLEANVKFATEPLKPLCFMWFCPRLPDYGLLVKRCYVTTRSNSKFELINNGCAVRETIFTSPPSTPRYSYDLSGAQAEMPTPIFVDTPAYIICELQFCPVCDCQRTEVTPPVDCADYTSNSNSHHDNVELLSQPMAERLHRCRPTTTTTAAPNITIEMDAVGTSSGSGRKDYTSAYVLGTLAAMAVLLTVSCCRHS